MEQITKKRSVELCLELWDRLSKDGKLDKESVIFDMLQHHAVLHSCFACEYVSQVKPGRIPGDACQEHCPLIGLWPNRCEPEEVCLQGGDLDEGCDDISCFCCSEYVMEAPTAWNEWRDCAWDGEQRKKYAKVIADYCRELLANWKED